MMLRQLVILKKNVKLNAKNFILASDIDMIHYIKRIRSSCANKNQGFTFDEATLLAISAIQRPWRRWTVLVCCYEQK